MSSGKGAKMTSSSRTYFSVTITEYLMKISGFWIAETKQAQRLLRFTFAYMISVLVISLISEVLDLYYCKNDIYVITYTVSSTIPVIVVLIKIIAFTVRKEEVMWLIRCAQDNFWYKEYDKFGRKVLDEVNKQAIVIMCSYCIVIYGTAIMYIVIPLVENVGRNGTDRILPFNFWWFNIPSTTTPYYEIIFVLEIFLATHSGIGFCSFDNFVCMMCLHVAGQFKILQHNLQALLGGDPSMQTPAKVYENFRNCILHHRLLILFVDKLERTVCYPVMSQLLISSVVLCVSGFQLCLDQGTFTKRLLFAIYFIGGLMQIFFITLNSNDIIVQSSAIGDAVYNCNWEVSSYDLYCKFRKNVLIVMLRSKYPCYLTAGKFFPVSLESFMKVLSATASYFTLLRQMDLEEQ